MIPEELINWRAYVVERSINLEWLVSAIICQHYFGTVPWNFLSEVLYDEYFNFGLKCNILEKVLDSTQKKTIHDLRRLSKIRNHFVHRGPHILTARELEGFAPDPKNVSKPLNFGNLFTEFKKLYPNVEQVMIETFKAKGGVLSMESPWPSA